MFTETARYEPAGPERFPNGATLRLSVEGHIRPLVPQFAASADAAVSFDGTRVLFSGKPNPGDPWQIWEVSLSGGVPRRLTWFTEDTITPLYLSPGQIVCARRTPTGFQLEIVAMEARRAERLTYAPGDHLVADVLRDGRILFAGPHPGPPAARDLYTVYADGSGVETYRCDHGRDRYAGVELSSGDIVFASDGRLGRFTSARAAQVDLPDTGGEFAGRIAEISPGEWLAAFRPKGTPTYGLYRWRPGQTAPEKLCAKPGVHAVQPVMVRPHPLPKRHPSALGDREGANLLSLNVYTSKLRIPAGSVAAVRVWTLNDSGASIALGEAPVETDGSFFVQTPSERAIRFELLDNAGKTVAAEKGWFWARRGEQRICVGCHAGPERAPENAVPAILRRSADPARMALPSRAGNGAAR